MMRTITSDNVIASIMGENAVAIAGLLVMLPAIVAGVALHGCWGCRVTLARDVLGFVNSKKYTDGTGNASVDTRQAEKKGWKINSVKTKKYIDADSFSDIVSLVLAMDSLAQPL